MIAVAAEVVAVIVRTAVVIVVVLHYDRSGSRSRVSNSEDSCGNSSSVT